MIVLDASAAVDWLFGLDAAGPTAELIAAASVVHAPHLLVLEVVQIARRWARTGRISAERGAQAVADLDDLGVEYHPHDLLAPRTWELRDQLTTYDACYVALAELLDIPLVTLDRRILGATHSASVLIPGS